MIDYRNDKDVVSDEKPSAMLSSTEDLVKPHRFDANTIRHNLGLLDEPMVENDSEKETETPCPTLIDKALDIVNTAINDDIYTSMNEMSMYFDSKPASAATLPKRERMGKRSSGVLESLFTTVKEGDFEDQTETADDTLTTAPSTGPNSPLQQPEKGDSEKKEKRRSKSKKH